jgi:membrane protein implicated in regulation of membrane protease activity
MRRLRSRKSFVWFGLAVVVFAAVVSALSPTLPAAILTPLWIVAQVVSIVVVRRIAARSDDQPVALLSLSLFRAPPFASDVA